MFRDEYGRICVEASDELLDLDKPIIPKAFENVKKRKETYFYVWSDVMSGEFKVLPGSIQDKHKIYPSDLDKVHSVWDTSEYYANVFADNPADALSRGTELIEDFINSQPVPLDLEFLKSRLQELIELIQLDVHNMLSQDILIKELEKVKKNLDRARVDNKDFLNTVCKDCRDSQD